MNGNTSTASTAFHRRLAVGRSDCLRGSNEKSSGNHEKGLLRTCCGNLLRPRMAEVRDPVVGRTEFVTCWRCPTCGRVSL